MFWPGMKPGRFDSGKAAEAQIEASRFFER
jgi:hypothetical protein